MKKKNNSLERNLNASGYFLMYIVDLNMGLSQGFLYGEVAQIGSITKNHKILVTSHSRRILNVRMTKNIYSIATILVTLKSIFKWQ